MYDCLQFAYILIFICSLEINVGDSGEDYYWAWAASVAGLVLHILAVVHAVLWGLPSLIVGSLVRSYHVFSYIQTCLDPAHHAYTNNNYGN